MIDEGGPSQSLVGGDIPGLVVLGSVRRQAETKPQEEASKQHPKHGLCINSCLQHSALLKFWSWLLCWWIMLWKCLLNLLKFLWSWYFVPAIVTLNKTLSKGSSTNLIIHTLYKVRTEYFKCSNRKKTCNSRK